MMHNTRIKATILLAALVGGTARAGSIADSEADFSGNLGDQGWFYGFYDGPFDQTDFQEMTTFTTSWTRARPPGGYWTQLGPTYVHPNGETGFGGASTQVNWAVRRWVASESGVLSIRGRVWDSTDGNVSINGIQASLYQNGELMWTDLVLGRDLVGKRFVLERAVSAGDIFDFTVDPRGNDGADHFFHKIRFAPCVADLAVPAGLLDLADVIAFIEGFTGGNAIADVTGDAILDLADITLFAETFTAGCP